MARNSAHRVADRYSPVRTLAMLAIGAAVIGTGEARAQNYPWCSNFADGAGTNCGFSTEQQCRITIQGSGGYCDHNNQYRPAAADAPAGDDLRRQHRTGKHS
jgi:hypothetical protein